MVAKTTALLFILSAVFSSQVNHNLFALFLEEYVDESGYVDYHAIHQGYNFQEILEYISGIDPAALSDDELLAFYTNSYNVLVIKNVTDHWPVNSPMDVPGFFKDYRFTVAGEYLSLDDIEHKKIFPLDDVLVHFGLVCAARSCPRLINKPFEAISVREQLHQLGREFFQNSGKNRLDTSVDTLYLSEIFKWFRPNFENRYGSLVATAQHFLKTEDSLYIAQNEISVAFLEYDWTLNVPKK